MHTTVPLAPGFLVRRNSFGTISPFLSQDGPNHPSIQVFFAGLPGSYPACSGRSGVNPQAVKGFINMCKALSPVRAADPVSVPHPDGSGRIAYVSEFRPCLSSGTAQVLEGAPADGMVIEPKQSIMFATADEPIVAMWALNGGQAVVARFCERALLDRNGHLMQVMFAALGERDARKVMVAVFLSAGIIGNVSPIGEIRTRCAALRIPDDNVWHDGIDTLTAQLESDGFAFHSNYRSSVNGGSSGYNAVMVSFR